jgi:F-type H+-transporting ATPase subunit gamma
MKTLAASSLAQYEKSALALSDYLHTVELGLGVSFRSSRSLHPSNRAPKPEPAKAIGAVVFGSDLGLVGKFNEAITGHALNTLTPLRLKPHVWAIGERVQTCLLDAGHPPVGMFSVPTSIQGITTLVSQILRENDLRQIPDETSELYLFYNRPMSGTLYEPICQRILPLDEAWIQSLEALHWPTHSLPEVMGGETETLRALIREYLFVSIYRASAESLASENASRLAAMQRADKNISELLENLNRTFHRIRQSSIDEELFDVISGFEALNPPANPMGKY